MALAEAQSDRAFLRLSDHGRGPARRRCGELRAIDLFEVTLTGAPANSDTRVLSAKSVAEREHEVIAAAFAKAFAVSSKPDQPASHGKELADLSFAELKAYGDELTKDIETRPIRIMSFEC
jgi:hypothetical protein